MRLKKIAALHALALVTLSAPAFADVQDIESANNQVAAQIQDSHIVYYEIANGGLLDSEDGHIKGYGLSGYVMKDLWLGHDYLAVQFSSFYGQDKLYGGHAGESRVWLFGRGILCESQRLQHPLGKGIRF